MLAASTDPASTRFTRSDAVRLIGASVLLVAAMSLILGLDFLPAQPQLELGKPAATSVQAPRADSYDSEVLTERERAAARAGVEFKYD
jgi:membrane-associated HD superfamily phosphohydrolase